VTVLDLSALDLSAPEATAPMVMEGPAEAIWRALDVPQTAGAVCAHVAADFGLPASEVAADVVGFLEELHRRGLVERREADPGAT
jgi:Coenzyme PQQ synthesis protein D (PqqD)